MTQDTPWTPGPWVVEPHGRMPNGIGMYWLKGGQISLGSARQADATLCAAAPAMYHALAACADDLEAELRDRWGDDPRVAHKLERDLSTVREARAALASARGE